MSQKAIPRKLLALNINDEQGQLNPEDFANFVTIKGINSYIAAQKLVLEEQHTSPSGYCADIFLVDINFDKDRIPEGLNWGASDTENITRVKPFGPLLALPFLGREICAFVPYSNYWADPGVAKNGLALVALSLLLSITERRSYTLSRSQERVERFSKGSLHQIAESALYESLAQLRNKLKDSEAVQLVGIPRTIRRLQDLEETALRNDWQFDIPLADAEGPLSISFDYRRHSDCIELSSLFADVLNFSAPSDPSDLSLIYETLEQWKPKSIDKYGETQTLYEVAKQCLEACGENKGGNHSGKTMSLKDVLNTPRMLDGFDKHLVTRIVMEFAWVRAWESEDNAERRISRVHEILNLGDDAPTKYKRLLTGDGKKVISKDEDKWRSPFKSKWDGVNDAYQLDKNEPGNLTPTEQQYCIEFAGELGWDETYRTYPLWMTA